MGCMLPVLLSALRTARLDGISRKIAAAGAACVSAITVTALVFGLACRDGGCPRTVEWSEETWGGVKSKNEYCEFADTASIVQTIANSFSNAGFVCVGTIIIFVGINDMLYPSPSAGSQRVAVAHARVGPYISVLWGLSQVYVGAGSFMYHASRTPLAQRIDVAAIYSTLSVPILYDLIRFTHWEQRPRAAAVCFAIIEIALSVLAVVYKHKMRSTVMLPTLIAVDILLQLFYYLVWPGRLQTRRRLSAAGWLLMATALALGGIAFGIRSIDRGKDCPFPERGVFQAHALFHVLASAALGFG